MPSLNDSPRCWCGCRVWAAEAFNNDLVCKASPEHDWRSDGRPKTIRKIYISGPMSGKEDCNYPAFNDAEAMLKGSGYEVVNPASTANTGHYTDILRRDLKDLLECDAVALLDDWWESRGVQTEVQIAGLLKMPVRHAMEWVEAQRPRLPEGRLEPPHLGQSISDSRCGDSRWHKTPTPR